MKTKHIFFTLLFLLLLVFAKAQDKYEFMIISYEAQFKISISIDGNMFLSEKVNLPKEQNYQLNANPLLLKVKEYQDKGWEIITLNTQVAGSTGNGCTYFAYLRKKKN
jgi:hypothetical protein